jgi:hypothetical protein
LFQSALRSSNRSDTPYPLQFLTPRKFQSALRSSNRSDCGPFFRLSHNDFLHLLREDAKMTSLFCDVFVKEQSKVSTNIGVVPRREIPVGKSSLMVRGRQVTESTAR